MNFFDGSLGCEERLEDFLETVARNLLQGEFFGSALELQCAKL
jgi:hypothetical protein